MSLAILNQLRDSFETQQMVYLNDTNNGVEVRTMDFLSRLFYKYQPSYHGKRLNRMAAEVNKVIQVQERLIPKDVRKHEAILFSKLLKKEIKKYNATGFRDIEEMIKEIVALRLGVSLKVLKAEINSGFYEYAENTKLSYYLAKHGHTLKVDENTSEIFVMMGGKHSPWNVVKDEFIRRENTLKTNPLKKPWVYGSNGIHNEDLYDWNELRAFKIGNPAKWNHQYVLDICVWCDESQSVVQSHHAWLRIKTPSGHIFSVGLYNLPQKIWMNKLSIKDLPTLLSAKPADLQCPDISEYWEDGTLYSSHVTDVAGFIAMKAAIEEDKQKGVVIHQYDYDCLMWCKKIATVAGIHIDTADTTSKVLLPTKVYTNLTHAVDLLPTPVQKVCHLGTVFFWNFLQYMLGVNRQDSKLTPYQKSLIKPRFTSWSDFFDPEKNIVHLPLMYYLRIKQQMEANEEHRD